MLGISWASTAIPLMEHGMIVEGDSTQTTSEKSIILSDHSSMVFSSRSASLRGSGGEAMLERSMVMQAPSLRIGCGRHDAPPLDFPGRR